MNNRAPSHAIFENGKFHNPHQKYQTSGGDMWQVFKAYWANERVASTPDKGQIPVEVIQPEDLKKCTESTLFRLGHSTVLLKLGGEYVLTDPVFSDRASPLNWLGPKRFHEPPISLDALPNIKVVVISHDHYDHLDKATVIKLADKVEHFVTPLGVGTHLMKWGIDESKIHQLDWWEEIQLGQIRLTATPAQHFSGRGLLDRDSTLWASWVIEGADSRVFFSGDSGYFPGFKEIGEKFGEFDITLIETGAYNALWDNIHMMPEDSLQTHLDLNGRAMLPIHNSTFDLALHDWFAPLETISQLAHVKSIHLLTPTMGAPVSIKAPPQFAQWWKSTIPEESSTHSPIEVL